MTHNFKENQIVKLLPTKTNLYNAKNPVVGRVVAAPRNQYPNDDVERKIYVELTPNDVAALGMRRNITIVWLAGNGVAPFYPDWEVELIGESDSPKIEAPAPTAEQIKLAAESAEVGYVPASEPMVEAVEMSLISRNVTPENLFAAFTAQGYKITTKSYIYWILDDEETGKGHWNIIEKSDRYGEPVDEYSDGFYACKAQDWRYVNALAAVMTAAEAVATYNLSEAAVRNACKRGSIPARKSGETWLVLRADAEERWGLRKYFATLDEKEKKDGTREQQMWARYLANCTDKEYDKATKMRDEQGDSIIYSLYEKKFNR